MTNKTLTPKQKKRESEKSVVVLYAAAGQEVRAKMAAAELVIRKIWTRAESVVLPDAEDVLVKLAGLGGPGGAAMTAGEMARARVAATLVAIDAAQMKIVL